jgi:hypothetical protein
LALTQLRVAAVRKRIVAKVDSIGLLVELLSNLVYEERS